MMNTEVTVTDSSSVSFDSNVFLQERIELKEQLVHAFNNGVTDVVVFFEAAAGNIPRNKPKQLKYELDSIVELQGLISNIKFTRTGKLMVKTADLQCALALVGVTSLLGISVTPYVQSENITSRFVVHDIDVNTHLSELGTEIQAVNNLKVKEMRRFTKRGSAGVELTETVLITIFGTFIPPEIKFFYMVEKIRAFYDRPRQCVKCWRFDHATLKCKNDIACKKCGKNHLSHACTEDCPSCVNCQGQHEANFLQCPAREKEMNLLKFKVDNHLPITEARRRFATLSKTQSYAGVTSNTNTPIPSVNYVTKKDLEQTLEQFMQRTQEMITQIVNQQMTIFAQTIEKLTNSIATLCVPSSKSSAFLTPNLSSAQSPSPPSSSNSLLSRKKSRLESTSSKTSTLEALKQIVGPLNKPLNKPQTTNCEQDDIEESMERDT